MLSYSISKSGLQGHQHKLNNLSHNIANVNTTGFKKKDSQFAELIHNAVTEQDVRLADNAEVSLNAGVRSTTSKDHFTQGTLTQTDDPLHLAVGGNGFFGVRNADNELLLTRDGAFHINSQNQVVSDRGEHLEMTVTVPVDQWDRQSLSVSDTGDVLTSINGEMTAVGRIPLYLPPHSAAIESAGSNTYRVMDGVNLIESANAPETFGSVMSGYLESSNVDLAQSITDMMLSQRAYSLNGRVLQSTDEMHSLINQFT